MKGTQWKRIVLAALALAVIACGFYVFFARKDNRYQESPSTKATITQADVTWEVLEGKIDLRVLPTGKTYTIVTKNDCFVTDPPYPGPITNEISRKLCWSPQGSKMFNVVQKNNSYFVTESDLIPALDGGVQIINTTTLFEIK